MIRAEITTDWVVDGVQKRPRALDDHDLATTTDVTGQPAASIPPDPGGNYSLIATFEDALLADLQADPNCFVQWYESTELTP